MPEIVFHNAQVVTPSETFHGHVCVSDGCIQEVARGPAPSQGAFARFDCAGDFLLPGLVEVHTDNLERHVMPRPKVVFPLAGAWAAHDAEIAAAGITTVFDALAVGDLYGDGFRANDKVELLATLDALHENLRAEHFLHVRCELPAANARELFVPFAKHPRLKLLSLMDHTPGQRQWTDIEHARTYYVGKKGWSEARFDLEVKRAPERQAQYAIPNRDWFSGMAHELGLVLASHDDTTPKHVDEALALGAHMSEFPTRLEAAQRAFDAGLSTVAGAPNVVRGGSHSGNVAAFELAQHGVLSALSSDYVPASLLQAAWLIQTRAQWPLHQAVNLVSLNPARSAGLQDRGAIAVGQRAALLRVHECQLGTQRHALVREVYRNGSRVA